MIETVILSVMIGCLRASVFYVLESLLENSFPTADFIGKFHKSSPAKEIRKTENLENESSEKNREEENEKKRKKGTKEKYAVLRDQATDDVRVVSFHEIISAKDRAQLTAGDLISHGLRNQRARAMVVLVGEFPT